MLRWIIFMALYILVDLYAYQAFRTLTKSNVVAILYWAFSITALISLIYQLSYNNRISGDTTYFNLTIGLLLLLLIPKMVIVIVMFAEDIFRLPQALYKFIIGGKSSQISYIPSRREFISKTALGLAAIPFVSLLYGMIKGKYNYKVIKHTLYFEDLPEAFNGYKITQISDIHSGSLDNKEKIEYAVNLINEQQSDIILFTGDLVNNIAEEVEPWIGTFSKLTAKDGVYSVLGNHDYGDYVNWPSEDAKQKNLEALKAIQKQIGFNLLLNESRYIQRGDQQIALIGVENWGKGGFKKSGDIKQATAQVENSDFKILMSHDPSHWNAKILPDSYHYHLTLSGHTHGMQFGVEIPGWIKWSPVKWRYKQWAGMYKQDGQYLNVNRGFGFLGYPGRVGIWPEITVVELKKGTKYA